MATNHRPRQFRVTWTEVQHVYQSVVVTAKTKDEAIAIAKKILDTSEQIKTTGMKTRVRKVLYKSILGAV